jgi:hypothetical protein
MGHDSIARLYILTRYHIYKTSFGPWSLRMGFWSSQGMGWYGRRWDLGWDFSVYYIYQRPLRRR